MDLPLEQIALAAIPVSLFLVYVGVRIFYRKIEPDAALIVYGSRGIRIVSGGGSFIFPAFEQAQQLSLRMMTLDVDLQQVYTVQGIPINVKAVAQVKVGSTTEHIRKAAEGFLGMDSSQVQSLVQDTVAGHLRGIVGTLTVEELYRDQITFQKRVLEVAHHDLDGMGFEIKSFVFREIQDSQGYLDALGKPKIQEALKNARIATANADRDATVEEEGARQKREQTRLAVDQGIAEQEKILNLKKAEIRKEVDVANAQAVKAGEMELKLQDISITGKEVERTKLELNATVREQADAKLYESQREAEASQYLTERQAIADRKRREEAAHAVKAEGLARAEAEAAQHRQIGLAEAEAIRARGQAEAEARRLLAEAFKLYSEAGLSIEALKVLPELAAAVAEPLSRAGATTIISQGGAGTGTGSARLSEDVVVVLSQLRPLLQQLAGVNVDRLLQGIAKLPEAAADRISVRPEETKPSQ